MTVNKNIVLYLIYTFLSVLSFFVPYTNLYLKENMGMSLSAIGSAILIFQVTKFLFEVPTGVVSDKYGRKISAIIGYILTIMCYIMLMLDNVVLTYLSFFIKGLGYTFISGSLAALFVESIDVKKLSKINSIRRVFFFFGFGVSAIIGGYLIGSLSYLVIIFIDIVIMIIILIIIFQMKENLKNDDKKTEKKLYIVRAFKMIKDNKIVTYFLIRDFIVAFSFISIENFYSTFLTSKGISIELAGVIIALQFFASSLIGYFIHNKVKILNKVSTYMIFSLLQIAVVIPIYLFDLNVIWVFICYLSNLIFLSIFSPIEYELFQGNIDSKLRSTIISMSSLMIAIGGISSYFLISLLGKIFTLNTITVIFLVSTLVLHIIINIKLLPHIKLYYKKLNE